MNFWVIGNQRTHDHIRMASDVLSGAVDHNMGTQFQGILQIRCEKSVVDN